MKEKLGLIASHLIPIDIKSYSGDLVTCQNVFHKILKSLTVLSFNINSTRAAEGIHYIAANSHNLPESMDLVHN